MPEEVNLSPGGDAGSNVDSDQQTQQHINTGTTTNYWHETHQHATMRTPEMVARALLRARERIQNKENLVPEKPGSARRGGRRRMVVSTSRSPLPSDYPRAPLQDITDYMHTHRRSRPRIRTRMQMHGTTRRQSITHDSPVQERSAQEGPLQVAQATSVTQEGPLQVAQATAVTHEETDVHYLGPGRDRNGSRPQQKKTSSSKNTAKTLMKMR